MILCFCLMCIGQRLNSGLSLQVDNLGKRSITYSFSASPTPGATYNVTITPLRAGIPTPQAEMFSSAGIRITSVGLTPDVKYRLQVLAVLNGTTSESVSVDFTTGPDCKIRVCVTIAFV